MRAGGLMLGSEPNGRPTGPCMQELDARRLRGKCAPIVGNPHIIDLDVDRAQQLQHLRLDFRILNPGCRAGGHAYRVRLIGGEYDLEAVFKPMKQRFELL